jgi:hypothetical protein
MAQWRKLPTAPSNLRLRSILSYPPTSSNPTTIGRFGPSSGAGLEIGARRLGRQAASDNPGLDVAEYLVPNLGRQRAGPQKTNFGPLYIEDAPGQEKLDGRRVYLRK